MDLHDWPCRLKSARRKKRLVKKDCDKQLIQLAKLRTELLRKKCRLPMIPLDHPYQKGWKKLFILRKNVQQSAHAGFYEEILKKINTVRYHYDKSFKVKKHRRWLHQYLEQPQMLREISANEWNTDWFKLSDAQKLCFYPKQGWDDHKRCIVITYVFFEPGHFVLAVKPHIIYEKKMHDEVLEQEIQEVANRIENNDLWYKIHRLTSGRRYYHWSHSWFDKPKYINKLKNKPMYTD